MTEIVLYKKHYQVFLKWIEEPLEISNEWGEILLKILEDRDCPPFVPIKGWLYNRFEISRVVPYEENISKERAEALAEHKRIQALINQ